MCNNVISESLIISGPNFESQTERKLLVPLKQNKTLSKVLFSGRTEHDILLK